MIGASLNHFQFTAKLGAGGMGEVYRARDTRLDREVAIKVLPSEFAGDAARLKRFEQEARTLASLSHPNILVIHDVGVHGSTPYLVSELLEGHTLREVLCLTPNAPLPQRKAIDFALQIANGLAAAHAKGIIHRDLKPENIFITKDGRVKILDFGLAKLKDGGRKTEDTGQKTEGGGQTDAVTLVQTTEPGMVLGTIGYMSPEQVRGEEADHRSDIFAFGCILYEMLSGQRAFRKETSVQTMNAILTDEPIDLSNPNVPAALERTMQRSLEKSPERRFQTAHDLAFALETLSGSSTTSRSTQRAPASRSYFRAAVLGTGIVLAVGLAFLAGHLRRAGSEASPRNWRGERLDGPGIAHHPTLSPDGKELAFAVMHNGLTQLGVMMVESREWQILTTNRDRGLVESAAWSLNGTEIYYDRLPEGGVYRISKYGQGDRLILERAFFPQMLPDGSLLLLRRAANRLNQLHRYEIGQRPEPLNAFTGDHAGYPYCLMPGGKEVAFFGWPEAKSDQPEAWWMLDLQSGRRQLLSAVPPPNILVWSYPPMAGNPRDNSLLYVEAVDNLYRIVSTNPRQFNSKQTLLALTVAPTRLDLGPDGSLYLDQVERPVELFRVSISNQVDRIPLSANYAHRHVLPLPDNRLLMPTRIAGRHQLMVFAIGEDAAPFLESKEESREPIAMLGREKVLCRVGSSSNLTVAIVSAADGRVLNRIAAIPSDERLRALAGAPDGRTIYYVSSGVVHQLSVDGGQPKRIRDGDGVAPDPGGEYLVIHVKKPEGAQLIRFSLSDGTERVIPNQLPLTPYPVAPNAVRADGRIAVSVAPKDLWYWPAAILDPDTGEMEFLPERHVDMLAPGWDYENRLVAAGHFFRASLWRFRPEQ